MNKKPAMRNDLKKLTDERNLFAKLLEETNLQFEGKVKELSLLKRIGDIISDSFNIESFCQKLVLIIIEETNAENCSLFLKHRDSDKLILKVAYGIRDNGVAFFENVKEAKVIFSVGEGIAGKVAFEGKAIMINDVSKDERFDRSKKSNLAIGSILCCPLIVQNQVLGVINLSSSRINAFNNDDIRSISIFSAFASSILNNAILYNDMSAVNNKLVKAVNALTVTQKKLKQEIEEGKQAEEALKKSEEKYYNLIEHANDAIVSINTSGMIIGFNKKAEEMFGYSREEVMGKPSYLLISPPNKEIYKKALKQFAKTGTGIDIGNNIVEGSGRRKEGEEFQVEYSYYTINVKGEVLATAIIRDISKRKEEEKKLIDYQNRLKDLTSLITLTEEKERRRFAKYLHDEIGQYLFASQMQLKLLKESLTSAEHVKILDSILNNVEYVVDNSRSLTFEISSPILHELGLEKALEWLAEHTYEQYNIVVDFEGDKQEKPLDDDMKIFLYQAVRELLTNVAKHAQTENAILSIKKDNSNIRICVEDNGVGFNPTNKHSSDDKIDGFGLFHINEQVEQLGGQLVIESKPNHGTHITLVVPLSNGA